MLNRPHISQLGIITSTSDPHVYHVHPYPYPAVGSCSYEPAPVALAAPPAPPAPCHPRIPLAWSRLPRQLCPTHVFCESPPPLVSRRHCPHSSFKCYQSSPAVATHLAGIGPVRAPSLMSSALLLFKHRRSLTILLIRRRLCPPRRAYPQAWIRVPDDLPRAKARARSCHGYGHG